MDPNERQQINHYVVSQITTEPLIAFFMTNTLKERYGDPMFKNIQLNLLNDFISDERFPYLLKYADPAVQNIIAEQEFNKIITANCSTTGGTRIQHGGAGSIDEWANYANLQFRSFLDANPNPADQDDKNIRQSNPVDQDDKNIRQFCWLIIFVEIVSILKLTDESYNTKERQIIDLIINCIVTNLNDENILLAYFRSIFGGTFAEQVSTSVCIGAAAYSATYMPLFINLLYNVLTDSRTMVTNAIKFVSAYVPAPIYDSVSGYVTSPSGLIAMGFMVYGILRHQTIPDPRTLASMKSIVRNDRLYDSVINFFFDMSPISIATGIPKNVKSWFSALKDRFTDDGVRPRSIIGFKSYIVQKFINVNNINSDVLIQFSGKFTTIMSCIWEGITDTSHKEAFITNYYEGSRARFQQFSTVVNQLQQHALTLVAEEVKNQYRGGSSSTLKHKRKRRSNNKKKPLKISKKSNKNKRRTSKNKKKR